MKQCKFCENEYKNLHGVHIHQFYCWVKRFTEMPIKNCSRKTENELMSDCYFIPNWRYWPRAIFKYIKKGEVGMLRGERYVCK